MSKNFKKTFTVSKYKDGPKESMTVNFDLSKLSEEDILEYARRSIVIQLQASQRAYLNREDKDVKNPVIDDTYVVPVPGTRTADPEKKMEKIEEQLSKLSPEQMNELLRRMGALT